MSEPLKIRVFAKVTALAPSVPLAVRVKPRQVPAHEGRALSRIPQDATSHRRLTVAEARDEVRIAYAIIQEMLARVGIDPKTVNIPVTMHRRFTQRMGDARAFAWKRGEYSWDHILGRIRLSSSPLWRRATPEKRRNTVIHELAHVLANSREGRNVGHKRAWRDWMVKLGEKPVRCHSIDRDGLTRGAQRVVNADANIYDFRIGDRVTFRARGRDVVGTITGYNRKTVSIKEDERGTWRCGPAVLRKIS